MIVGKEFTFDAAHFLKNYHGKCENLHGHTYRLQVLVEGPRSSDGMVIDFVKVKEVVQRKVIEKLDHANINDTIDQSTAENTSVWIWNQLKEELPLYEIRLWETPNSFVIYNGKE